MTYPALYGIERSKEAAYKLIKEALAAIDPLGGGAEPLRGIAGYLVERTG